MRRRCVYIYTCLGKIIPREFVWKFHAALARVIASAAHCASGTTDDGGSGDEVIIKTFFESADDLMSLLGFE